MIKHAFVSGVLAMLFCAGAMAESAQRDPAPFDIVLEHGHIVDGTGAPWVAANLGIRGGRVAAIGKLEQALAKKRIDARGMVIAPGFIDTLGQSEISMRILRKYMREEHKLRLEEAIRKFSSLPAGRLRLVDRGVLKRGMWADVVVFDPDKITDMATYETPNQLSVGMQWVFVNGVPVVAAGKQTNALPGLVLRGPAYRLPTVTDQMVSPLKEAAKQRNPPPKASSLILRQTQKATAL